jgi:hypothetical protein
VDPAGQPDDVSPTSTDYFRLGRIRLYQPDEVLALRLPAGVGELAAYSKTLAWVGREYFGRLRRDLGSLGVLIAVGIKLNRQTRLWCDVVDGEIPNDVWGPFVDLLEGAGDNVRPSVTGPVAFALECLVGAGPSIDFPMGPAAWAHAAAQHGTDLAVPDQLFELVFPD